jgi:subtilisin family serine protease
MSTRTVASRPQSGRLYVVLLVVLLWVIAAPGRAQERQELVHEKGQTFVRRESGQPQATRLIVKLKPGKAAAFLPAAARAFPRRPDLFLVPAPAGMSVAEAVREYSRRADVLYAEPDYPAAIATEPNDPRWSEQWDMVKIAAPAAWSAQTNSADVVVAVVDTGINFSHPDLQANIWTDPLNGTHGFTCLNGTVAPGGLDDNGHGTHVAGTIGAIGDNGLGVAGINWSVQLLALKVFNASGSGNISDVIACVDKMVELRQQGINIRVSNHSWSTAGYSQTLRDSLANAESAGVLHVCAAGNSAMNLEFNPSYPAAFAERGILAVAATDTADLPASFTNAGFASVDLAAPGVNILSTVPATACTNCDPSGYKLLSGTSMATPHVTAAAAALFHLNPALTPAAARDILLDPASVDPLSSLSVLAYSTTHARLNLSKAIDNPLVSAPSLNSFPQLSVPAFLTRTGGDNVTLDATVSDPDGDPVAVQWGKPHRSYLVAAMVNNTFRPGWFYPPVANQNPYSFPLPSLARLATVEYLAFANDGRGGSATGRTWLSVLPSASPGQPPSGTITATPASGPPGTTVRLGYTGTDPEGGSLLWGFTGPYSTCCYDPSYWTYDYTFNSPTVVRLSAQSIDRELNLSPWSSVVVRIGGATGEPPIASLTVDTVSGTPPLTVHYNATGSSDPDGGALTFFPECEWGTSFVLYPGSPTGTCTFNTFGPHMIGVLVYDNNSYSDYRIAYVMVHPEIPPDTESPRLSITAPASGTSLTGTVAVNVSASDDQGVTRVEIYRDADVLLGTDTTPPYGVSWSTAGLAAGAHSLYAKAWDQAGHTATSAVVPVSLRDVIAPTVAILAPAAGSSVSGQVAVDVAADDDVGVTRVEIYRSGLLLGTDTTAPYGLTWNTDTTWPMAYTLSAKAYDQQGNTGTSVAIPVTVFDSVPPVASITTPAAGAVLSGPLYLYATATDYVDVVKVELYFDTTLLGTLTSPAYYLYWNPTLEAPGPHTLSVKAYDQRGNVGTSSIPITVADVRPPAVSITSPAAGSTLSGSVTVSASAADDSPITKVEFWNGNLFIGTAMSAPYSVTWDSSIAVGVRGLTAKAYDQPGNSGTSPAVQVTVLDSIPPTVTITTPTAGSVLEGDSYINAPATDNVGVVKVEFFRDDALLGMVTSTPHSFYWNASLDAVGPHTLTVKAYDQQGNIGTHSIPVTLDFQAPNVAVTSPAAGASVSGNVAVNASAGDDVAVTRVELYLDGSVLLGTDTTAPYGITWNSATAAAGAHTLSAKAYDAWPHSRMSASVSVTVLDTTPPATSITSPAEGALVTRNANTTIAASASDNIAVTKVEFYVGTALTCTDTSSPYTCSWKVPKTAGVQYSLQAKAYDARNNVGASTVIHVTAN